MGDEELNASTPQQTLEDYFNELCAYAISVGMPYKDFWEEDPFLLNFYVKAEQIRQKKRNTELWLQGAYIYQAIGSLSPVLNAMAGGKAKPYLKEPMALTKDEQIERENEKILKFRQQLINRSKKGG